MWRIFVFTTASCWNTNVPCQHIYDMWLCCSPHGEWGTVECFFGRKRHAQGQKPVFYPYDFLLSCHMIFCLPFSMWPLTSSMNPSLCSSCGHCHCHTGLLPLIVCTRTPEITSIQVTSPMVKTKHTVTMHTHTHMCACNAKVKALCLTPLRK